MVEPALTKVNIAIKLAKTMRGILISVTSSDLSLRMVILLSACVGVGAQLRPLQNSAKPAPGPSSRRMAGEAYTEARSPTISDRVIP